MSPSSKVMIGPAGVGELVPDGAHLGLDDASQDALVGQDGLELGDGLAQRGQLLLQVGPAQPGQLRQPHVQDVGGLDLAELERLRLQRGRWPPGGPPTPGWRR